MSKRPSAVYNDPGYFYNQKKLLKLFTFSAIALVIGILGMIWYDFDRPWKDIQRSNMKWDAAKMSLESFILDTRTQKLRAELEKERKAAQKGVAKSNEKLAAIDKELEKLEGMFYLADMTYKEQKQYTLEAEYHVHEAKDEDDLAYWTKKLQKERDTEFRLRDAVKDASDTLNAKLAERKAVFEDVDAAIAEERKNRGLKRMALLAASIEKKRSYNKLRELPLLDFLAPPTKIEQAVLDNLVDNYEFSMPKKVDRCATCHVGSFRVGYDEAKFPDHADIKGNPAKFEEAVYRFVFDTLDAVWEKPAKEAPFRRELLLLRDAEIHHTALGLMFAEYDPDDGTIGCDDKNRKIWKKWRKNKKGRWISSRKKGSSIANYFMSVLEDFDPVYRTHPHFNDMVGSASPHPYDEVGCTTCHLGRGWSTDFGYAWHSPDRKQVDDWMTDKRAKEEHRHLPLNMKLTVDEAMKTGATPAEQASLQTGWIKDKAREKVWKKELGRSKNKLKYWDWPQHSKMLVQSSCLKCHKEGLYATPPAEYADVNLGKPSPETPPLYDWKDHALAFNETEVDNPNRMFIPKKDEPDRPTNLENGMDNFLRFGCYGCHKLDSNTYPFMKHVRPKVGPPLDEIATKTTKDWTYKWVRNPKDFRAETRMPIFWGLSNNSHRFKYIFAERGPLEADGQAWNDSEIYTIVEWMWSESEKRARKYEKVDLSNADWKRGEQIVVADYFKAEGKAKACIACHEVKIENPDLQYPVDEMAKWKDPRDGVTRGWKKRMSRRQGPALQGLASKLSADWLYAWLKNPRGYWHDTNMPDLRLTDQEAKDVVAYLMRLKNESFDQLPQVSADQNLVKLMAQELKVGEQRESTDEAIRQVNTWSARERTLYVGKKLFKHYGCFGCHNIEEYKNETPIGTELTEWGSKLIDRLEFNHAPIDHTRFDFAYTKMRNPRVYDLGMPRRDRPFERLKMPRFGFTAEESRDIATFMIGLVNDPIPEKGRFNPNENHSDIIRGRQVMSRYNCQGCHIIENQGGDVFPAISQDKEKWRPPNLIGQGIKTQPAWLFHFFKNPLFFEIPGQANTDRIRPWHSINMPSFGFTDEESRALVRYFAALSGGPIDFETPLADSLDQRYDSAKTLQYPAPDGSGKTITARAGNAVEEARALLDAAQCLKCHAQNATLENSAPSFRHTRMGRLRGRWLAPWLWGPGKMMPGTSMPGFFVKEEDGKEVPDVQLGQFFKASADRQIEALRDYIRNHYSIEEDR